jgi:hypothetical protein
MDETTILVTQLSDEALKVFRSAGQKALWEVRGLGFALRSICKLIAVLWKGAGSYFMDF